MRGIVGDKGDGMILLMTGGRPGRATIGKIGRLWEKYSTALNDAESNRFPEPTIPVLPSNRRMQKRVPTDSVAFSVSGVIRPIDDNFHSTNGGLRW